MRLTCLLAVAGLASAGHAQMVMVARNSQVDCDWLYGYAGDIFTGAGADVNTALLQSDGLGLVGSAHGSGYYPPNGHVWSATVTWDIGHSYTVTPGLGGATRIESSGLSALTSVESGATSGVNSINPGNVLTLDFNLVSAQPFRLFGSLSQNGPHNRNGSLIQIEKWNGSAFGLVFIYGTANTVFDFNVYYEPGLYRITAGAGAMAGQTESTHAAWNYTFEVVPTPGTAMLALAGFGLTTRRRRT